MNSHRPSDPLLDALLASDDDPLDAATRERSLAVLMAGARRRRRTRSLARGAGLVAVVTAAVWMLSPEGLRREARLRPKPEPPVTILHTRANANLGVVHTTAGVVAVDSTAESVARVSTRSRPVDLEIAHGDATLLSLVPDSVGFIGSGPDRFLVRALPESTPAVGGP